LPNGLAHISKARARAQAQNARLNDEFRRWLAHFANAASQPEFRALMASMSDVRPGKMFSRDEANERPFRATANNLAWAAFIEIG
jgi:hypothetical protein